MTDSFKVTKERSDIDDRAVAQKRDDLFLLFSIVGIEFTRDRVVEIRLNLPLRVV